MYAPSIIQLVYGIPGVFTYVIVIYAMRVQRRILSRSFISIFQLTATINTATWINSWIVVRLKREASLAFLYEWVAKQFFLGATLVFLVQQFYYAQNMCVLLLTFDRFAVIHSINRKTQIWSKSYLFVAVLTHAICLIINVGSRFLFNISQCVQRYTNLQELVRNALSNPSFIQLAFGALVFLVCSVLNIISLRRLIALRGIASASREISFFLISLCIFIAQILNLLVFTLITVELAIYQDGDVIPYHNLIYDVMLFASDLFSIGPAFYTLLLPGPVRRLISHGIKSTMERYVERSQSSVMIVA